MVRSGEGELVREGSTFVRGESGVGRQLVW